MSVSFRHSGGSHFVYHLIMNVEYAEELVAATAAAIAEPARARMLCCLMNGVARTSTELAAIADIAPSTASVHLAKLRRLDLVEMIPQGKHRYYSLADERVAAVLESLMVLAGTRRDAVRTKTPTQLRHARTCYDHMAGSVAVAIHDQLFERRWLTRTRGARAYELTAEGERGFVDLGIDAGELRAQRRQFACACLDWSERRAHLAGAVGAALLQSLLRNKWARKDLDGRRLTISHSGRLAIAERFGVSAAALA